MPITIPLQRQLAAETVLMDLRKEFPDMAVKISITGSIKVYPRFDSVVVFLLNSGRAKIYATFPLLYALFLGSRDYGYSDDESVLLRNALPTGSEPDTHTIWAKTMMIPTSLSTVRRPAEASTSATDMFWHLSDEK